MQSEKARILCVDDNADTCEAITILLGFKYETRGIKDPQEAIAVAEQEAFDLYIIDTWLPGHPDNDLCRRIRTSSPDAPIIVYSAAVYHADEKAAFEAGATAFIAKPYVDKLLETVSHLLD